MSGSFTFQAPISDPPYYLEMVHSRLDSDYDLDFTMTDNVTGHVIVQGTLSEYEDDVSSTNRNFYYIAGLTSGVLKISWTNRGNDGLYFSPFFTARLLSPSPSQSPNSELLRAVFSNMASLLSVSLESVIVFVAVMIFNF